MINYNEIWNQTYQQLKEDEFKGWDPYDGLTTNIKLVHKYYYTRLLFFYFNKFSPLNFRSLFGIKKRVFTQPYTLLGMAHLNRNEISEAEYFLDIILADSKKRETGYHCWDGLDMTIQMRNSFKEKGAPNVISTELAGRFILEFIKKTDSRRDELLEVLNSVEGYYRDRMLINYKGHSHFKYYDITPDESFVFNSNANNCAILSEIDSFKNKETNNGIIESVLSSIIEFQKPDGSWNYVVNLQTGKQKKQIDFHQGFILDSLLRVLKVSGKEAHIEDAYIKGLNFYKNEQFNKAGRSYYRLPKEWPVNIHNQTQGIITFIKAAEAGYGDEYGKFAETILEWTIENMMGKDGRFHYMKYPFFTNKIPYMRWSDANMLLALSTLQSFNVNDNTMTK